MVRKLAVASACLAAAVVVGCILAIGVARALVPRSACEVTQAQYEQLAMQMSYEAVRSVLGCEGVLVSKETLGDLVFVTYAWRGTAWPYGRVEARFINGSLEETATRSFHLSVNLPSR